MSAVRSNMTIMNGKPPAASDEPSSSSSPAATRPDTLVVVEGSEYIPVDQIERDLDELTYSGASINDLEVQLIRAKDVYQKILVDGRIRVDTLRKKLHSHIIKSEPYIALWRKAKQIQEASNKAAARYDKVNSQHTAAKEMIRVAESQLAACREEQETASEEEEEGEPSSPSPLDLAWQEMLNHATDKVVMTTRERRESEIEHRKVMGECNKVMEQYRAAERKLHSNIVKSRPYFEERYRVNQLLTKHRAGIKEFEQKISESKKSYSASLKRLEVLNTEMHERRSNIIVGGGGGGGVSGVSGGVRNTLDTRRVLSTGNTPELMHRERRGRDGYDALSMDSLQMSDAGDQFGGSATSLRSIETFSDASPSPDINNSHRQEVGVSPGPSPSSPLIVNTYPPRSLIQGDSADDERYINVLASDMVSKCLANAVRKLRLEDQTPSSRPSPSSPCSSPSSSCPPSPPLSPPPPTTHHHSL